MQIGLVRLKIDKMNKWQEKADYLKNLMGYELAKRYINAKIAHWESDEFIIVRDNSKQYWEVVLSCL